MHMYLITSQDTILPQFSFTLKGYTIRVIIFPG